MKDHPRFLGLDDAPFTFDDEEVLVVGVVTRGPGYVEAVLSTRVAVDGLDATEKLAALFAGSRPPRPRRWRRRGRRRPRRR